MTDFVDLVAVILRAMTPAERDSMAQAIVSMTHHTGPLDIKPEHLP